MEFIYLFHYKLDFLHIFISEHDNEHFEKKLKITVHRNGNDVKKRDFLFIFSNIYFFKYIFVILFINLTYLLLNVFNLLMCEKNVMYFCYYFNFTFRPGR